MAAAPERRRPARARPRCGRAGRRSPTGRPRPATARAATAPRYGPQTPGTGRGSAESAMWQVEVPAISARWRSSAARRCASAGPSTPSAPAWASIRPQPTRQPWSGRARCRGLRSAGRERCRSALAPRRQRAPRAQVPDARRRRGNPAASPAPRGRDRSICRSACTRAGVRAAGPPGQVVGEVEEQAGSAARPAADAASATSAWGSPSRATSRRRQVEHPVAARGAGLGLGDRAMVQPDDDVPAVLAGGRDARRPARPVAARPASRWRRSRCRRPLAATPAPRAPRAPTARPPPDVVRALLGMVGLRPMERDRRSPRPSIRPSGSNTPARALPVPTSTPTRTAPDIVTLPAVSMVLRAAPLCLPIAANGNGCQANPCANGSICRFFNMLLVVFPPGRRRRQPARGPCRICT